MKLLHFLGHKYKWPLDAYFENKIGDGFIISARSIGKDKVGEPLSGYKSKQYMPRASIDLEFYGGKKTKGDKFKTYPFHPVNYRQTESTEPSLVEGAIAGVRYQEKAGFKRIFVPNMYMDNKNAEKEMALISSINKNLKKTMQGSKEYFMTIPIGGSAIRRDDYIEKLLQELTDMDIVFDGYYVVCEPNLQTRKKISIDFDYYINLNKILSTLKKQGFKIGLGHANIDSLVFISMNELDFVSIGTYENLRNFSLKKFISAGSGGPSDGWYYSEKLLNFIKANQLEMLRKRNAIDLIRNEDNIFSDTILKKGYVWNIHKPDVHKNYLLAASRQLKELSQKQPGRQRVEFILENIKKAKHNYRALEDMGILLDEESLGYHLSTWANVLNTPLPGVLSEK